MQGLDESLRASVVAECLPRRFHTARDRRVRHDATIPNFLDDLVLRDEPLAVLDEQSEQAKDLRLEAQWFAADAQLDRGKIELERSEPVHHGRLGYSRPTPRPSNLHEFSMRSASFAAQRMKS